MFKLVELLIMRLASHKVGIVHLQHMSVYSLISCFDIDIMTVMCVCQ